jgi:signal transduction histidine kinase
VLRADTLVAVGVTASWLTVVTLALQWDYWRPTWFESYWLAGFGLTLPLALRRTAPGTALVVTVAVYPPLYIWWVPAGLQSPFHVLPLMLAAFLAARAGRSGWLVGPAAVLGTFWLVVGPIDLSWTSQPGTGIALGLSINEFLLLISLVAAATVLGAVVGRLDRSLASLAQRNRELEELQHVRTREAVQSERVQIARDLHDVVAHHVSAIVVRAQAAQRVGGDDAELYRDAVAWIAPEGRQALDAMRSLVRVLRDDAPPLAPTSTLADLAAVVARMRGAGLELETQFPEHWPPCPPAVGLAVVRVAQEALTNVVSHSAAHGAVIRLEASGGRLVLEVADAGPARSSARGGNGLLHMRERAVACGGTLSAGPDGDGWRVRLEVPLGG